MGESLTEAATLVLVGMAVVFSALAILMVAIMIISKLAPEKGKKADVEPPPFESETPGKERIAAIAVAIAKAMEDNEAGAVSHETDAGQRSGVSSHWLASGRERAMLSRRKAGRQWGRRSG